MAFPARFFPVQTVHLGPTGSFATFNLAALPYGGQLGMVVEDSGKVYRLVQCNNTADVATAAGFLCYFKDTTFNVVTSKQSESAAGVNAVAGAALLVTTNGNYIWLQCGGLQSISTAASFVAGDKAIGSSTDGQAARIAAGTAPTDVVFAVAYGSVSSGKTACRWLLGNLL